MPTDWPPWEDLKLFANSNFGAALVAGFIGSFAGAWGGAWAAQRIADRSTRRKQLWDEIQHCNAAIDAAGSICNTFLNLKGQHLVDMKRAYDEQRAAVRAHAVAVQIGRIDARQRLEIGGVDHGWLPEMTVPTARLEVVMMERLSLAGRPRGLTNMALRGVDQANEMIRGRNAVIDRIKELPTNEMVARVFGLPIAGGIDDTYGDCMQGMWKYSNDVIYFTSELCRELMKHGTRMEKRYERRFSGLHPRTSRVDFETERAQRLMPDKADYASWEETFIQLVPSTEGRKIGKSLYRARKIGRRLLLKPWKGRKKAPRP